MTNYQKIISYMKSALIEIKNDDTFSSQVKVSLKKTIQLCEQGLKNNKKKSNSEKFAEEAKQKQKIWWDSVMKGLQNVPKSDIND